MNGRKTAGDLLREQYMALKLQKTVMEKDCPKLSDVAGIEYLKDEIESKMYNPLFEQDKYIRLGAVPPKSLLIRGVSGVGKTFLVECFGQQHSVPVVTTFINGSKDVKEAFVKANTNGKCILMIKNMEYVSEEKDLVYQINKSVKEVKEGILVVFVHNNSLEGVKTDNEIFIKIPNWRIRKEILDKLVNKLKTSGIDTQAIADQTPGFVPGNLAKLIGLAVGNAAARAKTCDEGPFTVKMEDFIAALKRWKNLEEMITFDDIGALENVKAELEASILLPSRYSEKFAQFGITRPSGVMLYGPPGCGKTLIAKAVSCMSHCNFLAIKGPELITKYVGDSEKHLRDLFEKARNMSPCVLFFDEIDSLCSRRGKNEFGNRIVNQILTLLDGIEDRGEVYIIGATNRIESIDSALLRSGRFDKVVEVPLPNCEEACDIFRKCVQKIPHTNVDPLKLNLTNMSGADISGIIKEAAILCLKENFNTSNLRVEEKYFNLALQKFRDMKKIVKKKKKDII